MPDHVIRVRDMRARYGDDDIFLAECSCGWIGTLHDGRAGDGAAKREGLRQSDDSRPARSYRGAVAHPWDLSDKQFNAIRALQRADFAPPPTDPVWIDLHRHGLDRSQQRAAGGAVNGDRPQLRRQLALD